MHKPITDKEGILQAIRRVALKLGKRPSRSAFIAHTGITEYQVLAHFPTWNKAVEAAGLAPDVSNVKLDDAILL
jgi:hypothetical protein